MRLRALLGFSLLVLAAACTTDITSPSTSRAPTTHQADGVPTAGSGG